MNYAEQIEAAYGLPVVLAADPWGGVGIYWHDEAKAAKEHYAVLLQSLDRSCNDCACFVRDGGTQQGWCAAGVKRGKFPACGGTASSDNVGCFEHRKGEVPEHGGWHDFKYAPRAIANVYQRYLRQTLSQSKR